jgi:hypothetical protein
VWFCVHAYGDGKDTGDHDALGRNLSQFDDQSPTGDPGT